MSTQRVGVKTARRRGRKFKAIHLMIDGWVIYSPWVRTPDGHWRQLRIMDFGREPEARQMAEHYARELNASFRSGGRGRKFEAIRSMVDGWAVYSPWVQAPDEHWHRLRIMDIEWRPGARKMAEHYARELNAARELS